MSVCIREAAEATGICGRGPSGPRRWPIWFFHKFKADHSRRQASLGSRHERRGDRGDGERQTVVQMTSVGEYASTKSRRPHQIITTVPSVSAADRNEGMARSRVGLLKSVRVRRCIQASQHHQFEWPGPPGCASTTRARTIDRLRGPLSMFDCIDVESGPAPQLLTDLGEQAPPLAGSGVPTHQPGRHGNRHHHSDGFTICAFDDANSLSSSAR